MVSDLKIKEAQHRSARWQYGIALVVSLALLAVVLLKLCRVPGVVMSPLVEW